MAMPVGGENNVAAIGWVMPLARCDDPDPDCWVPSMMI